MTTISFATSSKVGWIFDPPSNAERCISGVTIDICEALLMVLLVEALEVFVLLGKQKLLFV